MFTPILGFSMSGWVVRNNVQGALLEVIVGLEVQDSELQLLVCS